MTISNTIKQIIEKKSTIGSNKGFIPTILLMKDGFVAKTEKDGELKTYVLTDEYRTFEINKDWDYSSESLQYFLDSFMTLHESESADNLVILTPKFVIVTKRMKTDEGFVQVPNNILSFEDDTMHFLMGAYRVVISNLSLYEVGGAVSC